MFGLFGGGKIVNRMADELGIERALYKSALTEEGINFAMYKIEFQAAAETFPNEGDRIAHLARHSINPAYRGLNKIAAKFPGQPQVASGIQALETYARDHGLLGDEQSAESSSDGTVMNLIFQQLPFCGLDPLSLAKKLHTDDFALGYVFGMSDMANYQFNRDSAGQSDALAYIGTVFTETLGGDGPKLLEVALSKQSTAIFAEGREQGASELGSWLKSQGQIVPLGLSNHFGDHSES